MRTPASEPSLRARLPSRVMRPRTMKTQLKTPRVRNCCVAPNKTLSCTARRHCHQQPAPQLPLKLAVLLTPSRQ